MKHLWKILFGILFALLIVGTIRMVSDQPRGQPIQLLPAPSPEPLIVHVTGAVLKPGVYQVPPGSRILDAIQAAGGFSADADRESLNLAAFAEDANQIHIPSRQKNTPTQAETSNPSAPTALPTASNPPVQTSYPRLEFPIDINIADSQTLETLPLIGQVRAARIIAYREAHGPFEQIQDLRNVFDITPEVYAAIRDLITVGSAGNTLAPLAPLATLTQQP
jgi:competence protein ComEA